MQFGFHLTSHGVISYVSLVMVLCGGGHISQTYFVSGPRFVWTPLRQSRRSKCPRVKIHLFVFVCFRVDKIWSAASPAPHLGSNLHSAGVPPPAGGEGRLHFNQIQPQLPRRDSNPGKWLTAGGESSQLQHQRAAPAGDMSVPPPCRRHRSRFLPRHALDTFDGVSESTISRGIFTRLILTLFCRNQIQTNY